MKLDTRLVVILFLVVSPHSVLPLEEPSRERPTDVIWLRKLPPEGRDPVWLGSEGLSPRGAVVAEPPKESPAMKDSGSGSRTRVGGGVIIAGLVTAFFAVVFAYVRVTRKKEDVPMRLVMANK
ncbi:hypothetical protein MLD38_009145 [Melastoma candidum]|uniref:Uncharacterized protein n=1 Tax=Melastoma candidum TaxID=119954 RepID=A0ACB9RWT1_9MYRT|nr:hypothetical protein MLD38_009145 [Melastoma candidum]